MKSCLTVCLIILLVFVLLIGGLVFAIRPPFRVIAPQDSNLVEVEAAFSKYTMERLELALDDYAGEGDMEITIDQTGLSQVLSNTLGNQIQGLPSSLKFTGVFMNIRQDYIQIGGGFKFWIIPVGISARMQIEVEDENLKLNLLSTHFGRIPLPVNFVLKTVGRFLDLPDELATLSVTAPLSLGEDMGVNITDLELQPGQILFNLQVEEGMLPEIPDSVVESFEESLPEIHDTLADNPVASETLDEIQALLEQSDSEGKKVNPLSLIMLGEKLHSSLSEDELNQLNGVLDDEVKDLLEQVQGGY